MSDTRPGVRFDVFTVQDRGRGKPAFWLRIGSAFLNKDKSLSVVLDALPMDGRLQIRRPKEAAEGDGR